MISDLALELFGYFASLIIAVSLMMTSVLRLRVLNLVGSVAFTVYAVAIAAWPVVGLNIFIGIVNVYFLTKLLRKQATFSLLEVDAGSSYLARFLEFYGPDIRRYVPGFGGDRRGVHLHIFVLRDLVPAGLLIGRVAGSDLEVSLDYATPDYRDLKIGRFLYGPGSRYFQTRGVERFVSEAGAPAHNRYLQRVGYTPAGDRWVRSIS
ncbi:MAG: hypothetical protein OEM97_00025 [Acidimicrobiia bacterium]|nr:hypothetical protein [Acidimicrobiia bacterium]